MKPKCAVPNCDTTETPSKNISYFKVPKNENIKKKWEEAIPEVSFLRQSQRICEIHFEEKYVSRNAVKVKDKNGYNTNVIYRSRLQLNAIPTLFGDKARHVKENEKEDTFNSTENYYSIQSQKIDQQQSSRFIFNIVEPSTGEQFVNENPSSVAKSLCQVQQFALVESVNKLNNGPNENFAFNKTLDEFNYHSDENINEMYPPISKTLEQCKQDNCYANFPFLSNLNKPELTKPFEIGDKKVDHSEIIKKAVCIKLIESNNQTSDLLVENKTDNTINEFNNIIKMNENNQNGKSKKTALKSILGKNKTKTKKISEKSNQTYTVEEHDGHVVIDINKKKKVDKKTKAVQKTNSDKVIKTPAFISTKKAASIDQEKNENKDKVIINLIRQNRTNIDLNKKIMTKEKCNKSIDIDLVENTNKPIIRIINNKNTPRSRDEKINQFSASDISGINKTTVDNNIIQNDISNKDQQNDNSDVLDHNYAAINNHKPKKINFTSTIYIDDSKSITLPKSWGIIENYTKFGKRLVFTHADTDNEENINNVLLKKSVTVDMWNGRIRYFVYGRQVDHENIEKLPEAFSSNDLLLNLLRSFQNINVCEGIGPIDSKIIRQNILLNDVLVNANNFYSTNCSLVAPMRKCESCKKFRRSILSRKRKLPEEFINTSSDKHIKKEPEVIIKKINVSSNFDQKTKNDKKEPEVKKLSSISSTNERNGQEPEVIIKKLNISSKSENNRNDNKESDVEIKNFNSNSSTNKKIGKDTKVIIKKLNVNYKFGDSGTNKNKNDKKEPEVTIIKKLNVNSCTNEKKGKDTEVIMKKLNVNSKFGDNDTNENKNNKNKPEIKIIENLNVNCKFGNTNENENKIPRIIRIKESNVIAKSELIKTKYRKLLPKKN